MRSEISRLAAILGHTKGKQVHGHILFDGRIAVGNAAEGNPDNSRADCIAVRPEAIRGHINEVGSNGKIRKIHEEAGNFQHRGGDIEDLPSPCFHIICLSERQPLNVVSCRRAVLHQPHERINRRHVVDDLIAAKRNSLRIVRLSHAVGIDKFEALAAVNRYSCVPIARVEDNVPVHRHTWLTHVAGRAILCRLCQRGVELDLDVLSSIFGAVNDGARIEAVKRPLLPFRDKWQQAPRVNTLGPRDSRRRPQMLHPHRSRHSTHELAPRPVAFSRLFCLRLSAWFFL